MSRGWFTDSLTGLGTKESYEAINGAWIVELAELAATKRSDVETIKNFISKQEDRFRPAYGRYVVTRPRQAVFYCTTNDFEFQRDTTGGRRFWPVEVHGVDRGQLSGLEEVVDMVWAEAAVRYRAGESLWLDDPDLYKEAEEEQALHTTEDVRVGIIEDYLDTPILPPEIWNALSVTDRQDWYTGGVIHTTYKDTPTVVRRRVSNTEILCECFGKPRSDITKGGNFDSRDVSAIMANLPGWKKAKSPTTVSGYGRQRVYYRADDGVLD